LKSLQSAKTAKQAKIPLNIFIEVFSMKYRIVLVEDRVRTMSIS
jgi:hypothetical protein